MMTAGFVFDIPHTDKIYLHPSDPFILPHQQVDKGAIKFVLSGANIMCPGLTSPGAKLYPAEADTVVVSFYTSAALQAGWFLYMICNVLLAMSIFLCRLFFNMFLQAIMAEGKQHALCVGVMKMSAESM